MGESRRTVKCVTPSNRFHNYTTGSTLCLFVTMTLGMFIAQSEASTTPKDIKVNNRPIIGILAQESKSIQKMFPNENYTSYIAASYVKGVEASGARVVPIMIGKDRDYYEDIMSKLNGANPLSFVPDECPLLSAATKRKQMFLPDEQYYYLYYLGVTTATAKYFRDSQMFRGANDDIVDVLSTEPVTVNNHDYCVVENILVKRNLTKDWQITSFSDTKHGIHFVWSIESNKYPFYGTQFHPEKPAYEWMQSKHYRSDKQAVVTNRHFYDFFVDECRKNFHSFPSVAEETAKLIYNYAPRYTGSHGITFEQCYGFKPKGNTC